MFRLIGVFGAGSDLHNLSAAVGRLLDPTIRGVFLEMTHVTQLDCTGIGALIQIRNQAQDLGRTFGLVHVDSRLYRLLDMAGLAAMFGVFDNDDKALTSVLGAKQAADRLVNLPRRVLPGRPQVGVSRPAKLALA